MTDQMGNEDNWDELGEDLEDAASPPEKPADPEVVKDHDPEDFEATYTVQDRLVDGDGTVHERGETIAVRCDRCAMWETPLDLFGGKALCAPGQHIEVEVEGVEHSWPMAPDRYSCRRHFVPREDDIEKIVGLLAKSYGALLALKWAFPTARAAIKLQERIDGYFKQHNPDGAIDTAIANALTFSTSFYSQEQFKYVKPLIERFVSMAKASKKAPGRKKAKKVKLVRGSTYEWDVGDSRVSGWLHSVNRKDKLATFMISKEHYGLINPEQDGNVGLATYPFDAWYASEPAMIQEVIAFVVGDSDGE